MGALFLYSKGDSMCKLIKMRCEYDCGVFKECKKDKNIGINTDEITEYVMNCIEFEDKADHAFMDNEMQNNKI